MSASLQSLSRTVFRARRFSLLTYLQLARQRRELAQMDDAKLNDLGLTRDDALTEARRPIWDVPSNWTK